MKQLKNVQRGRISAYVEKYPTATYIPRNASSETNPLWGYKADLAFPSATQNEINEKDAQNLVDNGVILVGEGANMPTTLAGVEIFQNNGLIYLPAKAANAGGVAVSGLEMAQNGSRLQWTREKVDQELHQIMKNIYATISQTARQYGREDNFVDGANIASFLKVSGAMIDQGYV